LDVSLPCPNRVVCVRVVLRMKLILGVLLFAGVGAKELSKETWEEETAGKSVFVKFLAPW